MESNNKAKLEEQTSSRLTDTRKGLAVAKEEGEALRCRGGDWQERANEGRAGSQDSVGMYLSHLGLLCEGAVGTVYSLCRQEHTLVSACWAVCFTPALFPKRPCNEKNIRSAN